MELPSKILEQIAFNTRSKSEEQMLNVMDKSLHERHLAQPMQIINRQFKIAVRFLTGYNGIFNVKTSKKNFISHYQSTVMILRLNLFQPAHMNSRAQAMNLIEILSKKSILLKQIIHFSSNRIFQL